MKVGWLDQGNRGLHKGKGDCLKYLKRKQNRKEERGNKDFKEGEGKLGQGVGALKKGRGTGTPLQTMAIHLEFQIRKNGK